MALGAALLLIPQTSARAALTAELKKKKRLGAKTV